MSLKGVVSRPQLIAPKGRRSMVQIHPSPLAEPDNSAARLHFPFLLREGAMYGVGKTPVRTVLYNDVG